MNREILFRGKRTDIGMWEYGNLSIRDDAGKVKYYIGQNMLGYEVTSETIGQYTGLTDKNGKKIFEGDICRFQNVFSSKPHIGVVRYYASAKPISDDGQFSVDLAECNPEDLEVIGNIHDNPELLGGAENAGK